MKSYRFLSRTLTALLLASLLTACGFKLKASGALPLSLRTIYIPSFPADMTLQRELALALQARQVTVVNSTTAAPYTLRILSSRFKQTMISASTDMQLRNYVLVYEIAFQVTANNGNTVIPATHLTLTRNYTASIAQMLNESGEYGHVRQVLRQDAIKQIIERLYYLKLAAHAHNS